MNRHLLPAQRSAVIRLEYILNKYRGAVLRGEEGVGKTIIAAQIAEERGDILYVAPAKDLDDIRKKIDKYKIEFGLAYEDNFTFVSYHKYADPVKMPASELKKYDFIIFDESHTLANWSASWTQRFVRSNFPKYLFLTATPMVTTPRGFLYVLRKCGLFSKQTTKDFDIFYFDAKPSKFGDFLERGEFQNEEHFQINVDKVAHELKHIDINPSTPPLNISIHNVDLENYIAKPIDITQYSRARVELGLEKAKASLGFIKSKLATEPVPHLILTHHHKVAKYIAEELGLPLAINSKAVYKEFDRIKTKGGSLVTTLGLTSSNLDLNECSNVILVESSYSFATDRQSIRRCQRLGKDEQVNVTYIAAENDLSLVKSFMRKDFVERYDNKKNFRPSSMATLEKCAGSFWIEDEDEKPAYIEAASMQGTVNHAAVERMLRRPSAKITADIPPEVIPMIEFARKAIEQSEHHGVESKVVSDFNPRLRGTVDFWAWNATTKHLLVIDYKNGNSPVKVKDNLQLLTYAALICDTHFLKPKDVKVMIFQKEKSKCAKYMGEIIEQTKARLKEIINRVLAAQDDPLSHLNKGTCDFFCPAKKYHEGG